MTEYLIRARNLSFMVPTFMPSQRELLRNPGKLLADLYISRDQRKTTKLLDNLRFDLKLGERLGLIGHNGAGKSTLLRVLAGIYPVSEGKLEINGTPQGLFDVRFGMDFQGTGLENIYLRGLQMGLKLSAIRDLIPEVVAFAELEEVINHPIRTYSTGMLLRLGFAISTMTEPDILLLDEWIGAGDIRFRNKTRDRMNSLVDHSRGMVIATHNMGLMRNLCERAIVLMRGKIVFDGPIDEANKAYHDMIEKL